MACKVRKTLLNIYNYIYHFMKDFNSHETDYRQRLATFSEQIKTIKSRRSKIAWLRLIIFIATIYLITLTWYSSTAATIALFIAGLALFLRAISFDLDLKQKMQQLELLSRINERELRWLSGKYAEGQTGLQFAEEPHPYINDLDILGENSLFQFLNRCTSEGGMRLLAKRLQNAQSPQMIQSIREGVKELATEIDWRQQLEAYGLENPVSLRSKNKIEKWLLLPAIYTQKGWPVLTYIFPVVGLTTIYCYLADILSLGTTTLVVIVLYSIALSISKKITVVYEAVSDIAGEINTLYYQLKQFESKKFQSAYLAAVQKSVQTENSETAVQSIRKLEKTLNRFDVRHNMLAFPVLNTLMLWDLRQLIALNKWKKRNENNILKWFDAIAEAEYCSSLACLHYNEPGWIFPMVAENYFTLKGKEIGHPLIEKTKRVDNTFSIEGSGKIGLITGSNMGGKSTFLRSLGINMVLALMGSPVCATGFEVSEARLMTSMRISDNLAENTSTFYAELKKLQWIIEAVKRKEKLFILLDEILRGTNSFDKHTGSKALIEQLIRENTVAVIATHDTELTILKERYPDAIFNYHFDVQVENEELYFDYKLKEGVCRSLNASLLMKKIGIEV